MKKILALACMMLLTSSLAYAKDISSGTIELNGSTGLGYSSLTTEIDGDDVSDLSLFDFHVAGLYYVIPNVGIGGFFDYEKEKIEPVSLDSTETTVYSIGGTALYNFSLSEMASVFASGNLGYVSSDIDGLDSNGWGWNISGGLKYFLTDAISANGILGYGQTYLDDKVDLKGWDISGGLSVYFGGL